jgi:MerR family transcriptional regulator, light-induced transcriptional regulator
VKPSPDAIDTRPRHPIAVAAERTGLSQDVLRVWERRYGAVEPGRAAGGQRLYSDADIARLALLHAATQGGRSIGQVVKLPSAELAALIDGDIAARGPARAQGAGDEIGVAVIESALGLTRTMEAGRLNDVLRRAAAEMGIPAFLEGVAAPLLRRLGDEWHAGRLGPGQEHLASSALHDIVIETMRSFMPGAGAPRVLVTTPAGERHVIGAALVGAAASVEGWAVLYLGGDLPAAEIIQAAASGKVRAVALSVVYVENRDLVIGEIATLRSRLPADVAIIVGGRGAERLRPDLMAIGVPVEASLAGLVRQLRALAAPEPLISARADTAPGSDARPSPASTSPS